MRCRINKRTIDELRSNATSDVVVWDTELRGFGVRILPTGAASFLVQYRNKHGRSRRKTVGHYPPLSVQKARALARADLSQVAKGIDPLHAEEEARRIPTR